MSLITAPAACEMHSAAFCSGVGSVIVGGADEDLAYLLAHNLFSQCCLGVAGTGVTGEHYGYKYFINLNIIFKFYSEKQFIF